MVLIVVCLSAACSSIENIPFPSFADVDDLKFEQLETLYVLRRVRCDGLGLRSRACGRYASNTMLKAVPIQVKNLPALKELYVERLCEAR